MNSSICSVRGYAILASPSNLDILCGLENSAPFDFIFKVLLGRFEFPEFIVGVLQQLPVPELVNSSGKRLAELAMSSVNLKRAHATANETCHIFYQTALLQLSGSTLSESLAAWQTNVADAELLLAEYQCEIDDLAFRLYRIEEQDRKPIEEFLSEPRSKSNDAEQDVNSMAEEIETELAADPRQLVADLLSYAVGCVFGRWDVRFATGERQPPDLPAPFAPLRVCSPGKLTGEDGLPLHTVPSTYPLRISWDGILVDDTGSEGTQPRRDDIVYRVREVLDLLWGDRAEAIEQEACESPGVRELREYFRRPASFFDDHLKRYSKSRRKAPIYWPLSTASGSYTVWVYYQRLTDQTLYTIVNRYVAPKIAEVERTLAGIEKEMATASGRQASLLRDRWQEARAFIGELHDFRQEPLRVAGLPYKPDLNDGVIINAAPLHRLFRHRQWARDTRDCWERLERGEYEWAHMAYTIWPERVREVCRRDRSIAIAHGLEALYEPPSPSPGRRRGRQRG